VPPAALIRQSQPAAAAPKPSRLAGPAWAAAGFVAGCAAVLAAAMLG